MARKTPRTAALAKQLDVARPLDTEASVRGLIANGRKAIAAAVAAQKKPAGARRGRKPIAPELRTVPGSIRMRPDEWDKFSALGGSTWLRARIKAARSA